MLVSHVINNMEFLALNDQIFIPAKVMIQKIWNSVDIITSYSNYPSEFLQIFSYYNFGVTAR